MANDELNSYEFYVKNFPYIKYSIDGKYINQNQNVLLIIFYDNELYQKYLNINKENDFIKLFELSFSEHEIYNNKKYGVFIIKGNIFHPIDFIINDIFGEKRKLNTKELDHLNIDKIMKNDYCFYITMIKMYFFETKGMMDFKFNQIKNNFIDIDN